MLPCGKGIIHKHFQKKKAQLQIMYQKSLKVRETIS